MTDPVIDPAVTALVNLLLHYSFEQQELAAQEQVNQWLQTYPAAWVRLALIEALYQGRYKSISVEQFLVFWQRRGQPIYHFSHEFERLVSHNLPQKLHSRPVSLAQLRYSPRPWQQTTLPRRQRVQSAISLPLIPIAPRGDQRQDAETPPDRQPEAQGSPRPGLAPTRSGPDHQSEKTFLTALQAEPGQENHGPLIDQFQPALASPAIHPKLRALAQGQSSAIIPNSPEG